jgi:hypothetical protein
MKYKTTISLIKYINGGEVECTLSSVGEEKPDFINEANDCIKLLVDNQFSIITNHEKYKASSN